MFDDESEEFGVSISLDFMRDGFLEVVIEESRCEVVRRILLDLTTR